MQNFVSAYCIINFATVLYLHCHRNGQSQTILKYKITQDQDITRKQKIADFHSVYAVSLSVAPIPIEEYRNTFYILSQNNWLYIQNVETGKRLRQIYLSNNENCKFRDVSFQNELDRIYIESIMHPRNSEVIFSVIVFQILPLKLIGFVEFTRKVLSHTNNQVSDFIIYF